MATPLAEVKDLHEDTITVNCPKCNSPMVKRNRRSDGQAFWGCSRFPNCNGYRPYTGNGNGNNHSAQQPVTKKTFVPSEYQKAIFEFVKNGTGNAVVEAVAGCLVGSTIIGINRAGKGFQLPLAEIVSKFNGKSWPKSKGWNLSIPTYVRAPIDGVVRLFRLKNAVFSGVKKVYQITLEDGKILTGTFDHPVLTPDGWCKLGELDKKQVLVEKSSLGPGQGKSTAKKQYLYRSVPFHPQATNKGHCIKSVPTHRLNVEASMNGMDLESFVWKLQTSSNGLKFLDPDLHVHHIDNNSQNNGLGNLQVLTRKEHLEIHSDLNNANIQTWLEPKRVTEIKDMGEQNVYDLTVPSIDAFMANGIAVHNSGKTTTIVEALNYTDPSAKVAFVAFNRHIAKELQRRAPQHVQVSTLHSLGYKNFRAVFPNAEVDEYKTNKILDNILSLAPSMEYLDAVKQNASTVLRLVSLLQAMLMDATDSNLEWLEDRYGITVNGESPYIHDAAKRVYETTIEDTSRINYDEMIYFCASGIVPCEKFDFLFVDETQDLNKAQIEMVLKSITSNGRVVAVGDRFQSIYGFRAADVDAIPNLIQALEAKVLPLSITYRCPKSIVALINQKFPEITFKAFEQAIEGSISDVSLAKMLYDVKAGDLVLCRLNAPLVAPCFELIRNGRKATIRGRDIGKGLQALITKVTKKYHLTGLTELLYYLNMYAQAEIEKLIASDKGTKAATLKDQVETIEALSDGCKDLYELNARIEMVFSDDVEGVIFSSVHKAKGDEANRVYVLEPQNMPHKLAKKDWELQQEFNLIYVCYTRAKQELFFVR